MDVTRPNEFQFAKALIYGPAGHGKTAFLGSANDDPRTSPMLLLDYEGGTETLAGKEIDVVRIRDWQDYNEAYDVLSRGKHPYKSVGIDSISETHTMALFAQLDSRASRKIENLLEQGDYGIALTQMRRFMRTFRDLPLHVFYSALAKEETDVREGLVKKPAVPGSFAEDILGIPNIVGYLAVRYEKDDRSGEEVATRILVLRAPKIRTKVRAPLGVVVPDMIENPTVSKLLDLVVPQ